MIFTGSATGSSSSSGLASAAPSHLGVCVGSHRRCIGESPNHCLRCKEDAAPLRRRLARWPGRICGEVPQGTHEGRWPLPRHHSRRHVLGLTPLHRRRADVKLLEKGFLFHPPRKHISAGPPPQAHRHANILRTAQEWMKQANVFFIVTLIHQGSSLWRFLVSTNGSLCRRVVVG
jgi:hypothetical protein